MASWWVYMLRCGDGSLYTGITVDVDKRVSQHQAGKGAVYTRTHLPVCLVFSMAMSTRQGAMRAERYIKTLTRARKERLVEGEPRAVGLVRSRKA